MSEKNSNGILRTLVLVVVSCGAGVMASGAVAVLGWRLAAVVGPGTAALSSPEVEGTVVSGTEREMPEAEQAPDQKHWFGSVQKRLDGLAGAVEDASTHKEFSEQPTTERAQRPMAASSGTPKPAAAGDGSAASRTTPQDPPGTGTITPMPKDWLPEGVTPLR